MLQNKGENTYFLAKIGADTAENEQHLAENLPKICQKLAIYPTGEVAEDRRGLVAWAVRFSQLKHSGAHFFSLPTCPSSFRMSQP